MPEVNVLGRFAPHFVPRTVPPEVSEKILRAIQRFVSRQGKASSTDTRNVQQVGVNNAEAELRNTVGTSGSDVSGFSATLRQMKASMSEQQYEASLSGMLKVAEFVEDWKMAHPDGVSRFGDQNARDSSATGMDVPTWAMPQPAVASKQPLAPARSFAPPGAQGSASQQASAQHADSASVRSSLMSVHLNRHNQNGRASALGAQPSALVPAEAPEQYLLKDILHVCQGHDGRYVTLARDGCVPTRAGRAEVGEKKLAKALALCDLGWLFKRLRFLIGAPDSGELQMRGVLHQALSAAVTHELREYYRLIAMLQSLVLRPVSTESQDYLTLHRLESWLADPTRRMAILVDLARQCHGCKGGQLASILEANAARGSAFDSDYARRLLRRVSVPLLDMVHRWIYRGELNDPQHDFFVAPCAAAGQPVSTAWHGSYELRPELLPSFISADVAAHILRAGKTINFLREACNDTAWVRESATALHAAVAGADEQREPGERLQEEVERACTLVDARLRSLVLDKFGFMRHCEAMKKFLFFGQGDFASALMHHTADLLPMRASQVMAIELNGRLKKSMDASMLRFEPDDMQDRLHIAMRPHSGHRTLVADVLSLQYRVRGALASLLSEGVMNQYEEVSTFLWKLKAMEFSLQRAYLALRRVEVQMQRLLRGKVSSKHAMWHLLKQAHRVHSGLHVFCQTLQTYVMYDVLESSWDTFRAAIDQASDVDQMLTAHDAYLTAVGKGALLGRDAQAFRDSLAQIFTCAQHLVQPLLDSEAHVTACAATGRKVNENMAQGKWGAFRDNSSDIDAQLTAAAESAAASIAGLDATYATQLHMLLDSHPDSTHLDLQFVMTQVNFSGFYKPALDGREAEFAT